MSKFTSMAILLALSLVAPMKAFCEDYSRYYPPGGHNKYIFGLEDLPNTRGFHYGELWGPIHYLEGPDGHGCWNKDKPFGYRLTKTGRACMTTWKKKDHVLREYMEKFNDWVKSRAKATKIITGLNIENCELTMTPDNRREYEARSVITVSTDTETSKECLAFFRVFIERRIFDYVNAYPWNMVVGGKFVPKKGIKTKPDRVVEIGEASNGPVNVTSVIGCDNYMQRIDPRKLQEGEVLIGTIKPAEQMSYGTHKCDLYVLWK